LVYSLPMVVRGVRGATQLEQDTPENMREAVGELLAAMLERNEVESESIASIFFTATSDIHSIFPATAARDFELSQVPLMCAQELDIEGALPRAIRILMHINTEKKQNEIVHLYLRGAKVLRPDLPSA